MKHITKFLLSLTSAALVAGCASSGVKNPSGVPVTRMNADEQGFVAGTGVESQALVAGTDKIFYFAYDTRWRIAATYRESDSSPKEQFTYHNAGVDGSGGSSYIDNVIMRDRDANTAWATASADGVLEERRVYCQNWRGDISAVITDTGKMVEWVKYSAYGVAMGLPCGDTNSDHA